MQRLNSAFNVLDKSLADVSLLSGLLIHIFQFHLSLYHQHQRLTQAGVTLSRATLTNLVKRLYRLDHSKCSAGQRWGGG